MSAVFKCSLWQLSLWKLKFSFGYNLKCFVIKKKKKKKKHYKDCEKTKLIKTVGKTKVTNIT
jgi:hypothetical protein